MGVPLVQPEHGILEYPLAEWYRRIAGLDPRRSSVCGASGSCLSLAAPRKAPSAEDSRIAPAHGVWRLRGVRNYLFPVAYVVHILVDFISRFDTRSVVVR